MLCKKCSGNIKSDFKYCPYCGERIVNDFHDELAGLTPPFAVKNTPRNEDASFYVHAPREAYPDFSPAESEDTSDARWENAPVYKAQDIQFEKPMIHEPETPSAQLSAGEPDLPFTQAPADAPPHSQPIKTPADEPGAQPDEAFYYVYQPRTQGRFHFHAEPAVLAEEPEENREKPLPAQGKSMGVGMKLGLIAGILFMAGVVSVLGYYLLERAGVF